MRTHKLSLAASILAVSLTASAAHAQVVTNAGGEVTLNTQKTIVDRMIVADSLEIEMAQFAAGQTKNPAVKEFATLLVTDHRALLESTRKLASKADVGRAASTGDSSAAQGAQIVAQLKSLPADSTFDRAFVTGQIQLHQRAIENLKKWRTGATSPELQQDIDRALPVYEQHLARAQAVAAKL